MNAPKPALPGESLACERILPLIAGLVAQSDPAIPPLPGLRLTTLRNVKILGSARPGEIIHLEARVAGRLGRLAHAQCAASAAGRALLVCEVALGATGE